MIPQTTSTPTPGYWVHDLDPFLVRFPEGGRADHRRARGSAARLHDFLRVGRVRRESAFRAACVAGRHVEPRRHDRRRARDVDFFASAKVPVPAARRHHRLARAGGRLFRAHREFHQRRALGARNDGAVGGRFPLRSEESFHGSGGNGVSAPAASVAALRGGGGRPADRTGRCSARRVCSTPPCASRTNFSASRTSA